MSIFVGTSKHRSTPEYDGERKKKKKSKKKKIVPKRNGAALGENPRRLFCCEAGKTLQKEP